MEQGKKQEVFFKKEDNFFKVSLSTEELYTEVHGESSNYGTSANDLIKEMMVNVIALSSKQGLKLYSELTITDYGCGRSDATSVVGWIINEQGHNIEFMLQEEEYEEILNMLEPCFDHAASL